MVAGRKSEAVTPPAVIEKLLRVAGDEVVLVGGQSLGFWMHRFGLTLPDGVAAISHDTDFLAPSAADRAVVDRFAKAIGGSAHYPHLKETPGRSQVSLTPSGGLTRRGRFGGATKALTALVGQASLDISDEEAVNVDVIHTVLGLQAGQVRGRAVQATLGKHVFLVMHPLDVLQSRLTNLYQLAEKQNPKGVMQLSMAIDAVREFLRHESVAAPLVGTARRSPLQGYVSAIERMAVQDAGRKVARRFDLHVADAIDPSLIPAGLFWTKRWPALRKLMSPGYASHFDPP